MCFIRGQTKSAHGAHGTGWVGRIWTRVREELKEISEGGQVGSMIELCNKALLLLQICKPTEAYEVSEPGVQVTNESPVLTKN